MQTTRVTRGVSSKLRRKGEDSGKHFLFPPPSKNHRSQIRNAPPAPPYPDFGWKTWDHLGLSFLQDKVSERVTQSRHKTQTASSTRTWAPKILPLLSNCILMNFPNREELSFLRVTAFPKLSSRGLQLRTLFSNSPTFSTTGILRLRLVFPSIRG